ncbi:hypothetical protein M0805_002821 [Coniferiporia weirii]|nr:hypothetical protein M0805_002821 [Coniferiporia weirii]
MAASAGADSDRTMAKLSKRTIQLIDHAFNRALEEVEGPEERRPQKRRRIYTGIQEELSGGGFILDDQDTNDGTNSAPGYDSEHEKYNGMTHIPLSLIPRALQLLDLPFDDAEVLDVFANAASGWQAYGDMLDKHSEPREKAVSRHDWRAVCAVLVPPDIDAQCDGNELLLSDSSPVHSTPEASGSGGEASSGEEYVPERTVRRTLSHPAGPKTGHRGGNASSHHIKDVSRISQPYAQLTERQAKEILSTFTLFFPDTAVDGHGDIDPDVLKNKQIAIKDIARASASIKQKISAEEIIEMLGFFSSSSSRNNPTLSLVDFQRMMLTSKLV